MLVIRIKTTNKHIFTVGNKYTFCPKNPFESFDAKYIGKSRIDGLDIFQFLATDAKYPILQYTINNDSITEVSLMGKLEDHLGFFKETTYQKNSSALLEYCMDHYKINKSDLGDDEKFKPMMREIILNGLLPK